MTRHCVFAVVAIVLTVLQIPSLAQTTLLFAPVNHPDHGESVTHEEHITIDSSLIASELFLPLAPVVDTVNGWKNWNLVENFCFGKDRGQLTMIADLNALHPYFRDKIKELMTRCKKQGIELAIVESYRTHAKQNEYRTMGRNYTNSSGGRSKHQYGLAVDVVPMLNGVAVWDNVALWRKVGVAGEQLGLRWGGRWKKPYDPGHFEWTGGLTSVNLSAGQLPVIPSEKYPCIDEDLQLLKRFWANWESLQAEILLSKSNRELKTF